MSNNAMAGTYIGTYIGNYIGTYIVTAYVKHAVIMPVTLGRPLCWIDIIAGQM
jgi:hypothetical protein